MGAVEAPYAGGNNVAHVGLGVLVDTRSKAMQSEMWREVIIVKVFTVGIDVRLERCNHIRKLRILNCPNEDAAASTVVIVEVHLSLESEVEKVDLGKLKDISNIGPDRDLDWDDRAESWYREFKDVPKVIVTIVHLVANGC